MTPIDGFQAALKGLRSSAYGLERVARRVAADERLEHLPEHMVESRVERHAYAANVRVVQALDDMTGTLLDVLR